MNTADKAIAKAIRETLHQGHCILWKPNQSNGTRVYGAKTVAGTLRLKLIVNDRIQWYAPAAGQTVTTNTLTADERSYSL